MIHEASAFELLRFDCTRRDCMYRLYTVNLRYNDSIGSWRCHKMNLVLYTFLKPSRKACFILISSQRICFVYLLELPQLGDSIKFPKLMLLKVLNTMFLHNFWLNAISLPKDSWLSNYHCREFCRCIEYRYKHGLLCYGPENINCYANKNMKSRL